MAQQMEVFLQENTTTFIDTLFITLESKDYLSGPPKVLARKTEEDEESKFEEGKPDSTTSTPANVSELASDLKDAEHKGNNRRSSEVKKNIHITLTLQKLPLSGLTMFWPDRSGEYPGSLK